MATNWHEETTQTRETETKRTTRLGVQIAHDGRREDEKTPWAQIARGERKREHDADANGPYIRSLELTQRAAPAVRRTGRELLGTPTGCVRRIRQATRAGYRAYA